MTEPNQNQSLTSPIDLPEVPNLDELFSRDPLELSTADVAVIVAELRRQRVNFDLEDSQAKAQKRPVKAKNITGSAGAQLSLDSLDLDL